jgi:hypothetical protein
MANQQQRVVLRLQLLRRHVPTDVHIAVEDDPFGFHLLDAPLDDAFFHLEVGNPVAQQPAGRGMLVVDAHLVAGARQLLRRRQAGGARADDRHLFARAFLRSAMAHSMVLIVTGLSSMLSVQDASQGAGHTRPVISGKLLVECRLRAATFHCPR